MIIEQGQQSRWNAIIIDILREFIKVCEENQLTYYCCGGTAIGAIRHQGMIPWDDDIDVFMPRPDYDKFVKIAMEKDWSDYELVTPFTNANYPLYFVKLCHRHTTLQEDADVPCIYGLYVDVFPIDGAPDNYKQTRKMIKRFTKTKNKLQAISTHVTFKRYLHFLAIPKEWGRFFRKTIGFFFRKTYRAHLLKQLDQICRKYNYETSTLVAVYCGSYGPKEVFPKEWLEGTVDCFYEGLTVKLPSGFDNYLRQYYGDYMQLPPVEKRISHHDKAYFNLNAREPDEIVLEKTRRE